VLAFGLEGGSERSGTDGVVGGMGSDRSGGRVGARGSADAGVRGAHAETRVEKEADVACTKGGQGGGQEETGDSDLSMRHTAAIIAADFGGRGGGARGGSGGAVETFDEAAATWWNDCYRTAKQAQQVSPPLLLCRFIT